MATANSIKQKILNLVSKINAKTGVSDTDLTSAVDRVISGYAQDSDYELQSKTVTPSTSAQTVNPDSGYYGLSSVKVNAMPTAEQATPSISVSTAGLITASATQTAGHVAAGTKSATKQLSTQAAKTLTPSTSSQTAVASGVYTTGAVTVSGDANLVPGNIKNGVSIFGVNGSYSGDGGGGGSDNYHVIPLTLARLGDASAAKNNTIISGNAFVKANYSKDGFFAILMPLNAADSQQANKETTFLYHGNRCITKSASEVYGVRTNGNGTSNATALTHTSKISGSGYVVALRATSAGNVTVYTAAGYYIPAGNYLLILALAE